MGSENKFKALAEASKRPKVMNLSNVVKMFLLKEQVNRGFKFYSTEKTGQGFNPNKKTGEL